MGKEEYRDEYRFPCCNDALARREAVQHHLARYYVGLSVEVPLFIFLKPERSRLFPVSECHRQRIVGSLDTLFEEVKKKRRIVNWTGYAQEETQENGETGGN